MAHWSSPQTPRAGEPSYTSWLPRRNYTCTAVLDWKSQLELEVPTHASYTPDVDVREDEDPDSLAHTGCKCNHWGGLCLEPPLTPRQRALPQLGDSVRLFKARKSLSEPTEVANSAGRRVYTLLSIVRGRRVHTNLLRPKVLEGVSADHKKFIY